MIQNPPAIFVTLKSYRALIRLGHTPDSIVAPLALVFGEMLGHQPYNAFLKTYQLYLQQIPFDHAKAAWGINAAAATPTHQSK